MTIAIQLLGGLAVFLLGMKIMSESLQLVAGESLKNMLSSMTRSRFRGVLSGFLITSLIQSSSATTVMVVSFVNAGLISLIQAIGIIMGANIGTTVTAWLVSLLGFKVNVASFALPAIAIGVTMIFIARGRAREWGNVLIGFGLLFLGLTYLKDAIPSSAKDSQTFLFLNQFTNKGLVSVLFFIMVGTLITIVVQSSSASTTLTITLAYNGIIPYDAAAAMVLGENIGTTITANLAAIAGDRNAKKAALAHTMFNVIGVVIVVILFKPFLALIGKLSPIQGEMTKETTRFFLSTFHTTFNVLCTMTLIWFIPQIAATVSNIVEYLTIGQKPKKGLRHLSAGPVGIPQMELVEIEAHVRAILQSVDQRLTDLHSVIGTGFDRKKVESLISSEQELDEFKYQLLAFTHDMETDGVPAMLGGKLHIFQECAHMIEEVGDIFEKIGNRLLILNQKDSRISEGLQKRLSQHVELLKEQLKLADKDIFQGSAQLQMKSKELRKSSRTLKQQTDIKLGEKQKKLKTKELIALKDLVRYFDNISSMLNRLIFAGEVARYGENS